MSYCFKDFKAIEKIWNHQLLPAHEVNEFFEKCVSLLKKKQIEWTLMLINRSKDDFITDYSSPPKFLPEEEQL